MKLGEIERVIEKVRGSEEKEVKESGDDKWAIQFNGETHREEVPLKLLKSVREHWQSWFHSISLKANYDVTKPMLSLWQN